MFMVILALRRARSVLDRRWLTYWMGDTISLEVSDVWVSVLGIVRMHMEMRVGVEVGVQVRLNMR